MPSPRHDDTGKQQRVIFSLPPDLVADVQRYAEAGGEILSIVVDAEFLRRRPLA